LVRSVANDATPVPKGAGVSRFRSTTLGIAGWATQKTYTFTSRDFWRGKAGRFPCPLAPSLSAREWRLENGESETQVRASLVVLGCQRLLAD